MNLGINWYASATGWENADFNADGIVDAADLNKMGLNWQRSNFRLPADAAAVPEPMTFMIFILGGGVLFPRLSRVRHSTIAALVGIVVCLLIR